ncbi:MULTISPECIES: hypothetical protein [Roseomonadaceae]|uniref:UrcA family protein n=1 Tax=Falsiroseomonas oleicola TaxID=2801474 RepID=A0ABS6H916_9PROT|nr:hypothetical protein [Roseomonas oleicola]MBU8545195.1 hypothetical protein [Roseomonas oleicola]
MRMALAVMALLGTAPALAQGVPGLGRTAPSIPGLLAPQGTQQETPQQKREFCQRIATAAGRCAIGGGLSAVAVSSCLMQGLPPQDQLRVAQAAQSARGSVSGLLSECGIGFGR